MLMTMALPIWRINVLTKQDWLFSEVAPTRTVTVFLMPMTNVLNKLV
jgi:hypothetical protein